MDLHGVARAAGLDPSAVVPTGRHRGRVELDHLGPPRDDGRYVLVTAVNPTPAGEGKTVTTIALTMALSEAGHRSVATLRQSSLGPTFGRKGGGAGGGRAAVHPLEDALLGGLTDMGAVEAAHNLLAAATDDALHRGRFGLTAERVTWRRVVDVNDRALRDVQVGLGGEANGTPRRTGFDITAASEVMAVLTLARDLRDVRARLARIVVGTDPDRRPVTAGDLEVAGAMAALLRDAAQPTLMATADGTPILIHAGPFGNLSVGTSSVIADRLALGHSDVVVTEAGFGADLGAEKLLHIKAPQVGRIPDVVVLVTTVRAMRWHGGVDVSELEAPAPEAVSRGTANLTHHIERLRERGLPVVVTINRFGDETSVEEEIIRTAASSAGAADTVPHEGFDKGAAGCRELADAVMSARSGDFTPLVDDGADLVTGLEKRARQWYGASDVLWTAESQEQLQWLEEIDAHRLPVCVAKTHLSTSHDPELRGAPRDFTFPVRELRLAAGGGYVTALAGTIMTMPGLPPEPRFRDIDLDEHGRIVGLV